MQDFKIRCSAIADIMGYREKAEVPAGAKTYLKKWVTEQLYGKKKQFVSKYTDKGVQSESSAIDFASERFNWGLVDKNEQLFENDFVIGTPDIILGDTVEDIKCSWDCFTFPLFDEKPNEDYWWQLQGYMWLTGKKKAGLVYCLMDAPESVVLSEAKKQAAQLGVDEMDADLFDKVKEEMTYSNLPAHLRIKRYEFDYDENAIEQIKTRVRACRNYIESNLLNKYSIAA